MEGVDCQIGKFELYYCKSCIYHSTVRDNVLQHVEKGCESHIKPSSLSKVLTEAALKSIDHNYASGKVDVVDQDSNSVVAVGQDCPEVALSRAEELELQRKCNEVSGTDHAFICCKCKEKKQRGRPPAPTPDWDKMRVHLTKVHNIHFDILSPEHNQSNDSRIVNTNSPSSTNCDHDPANENTPDQNESSLEAPRFVCSKCGKNFQYENELDGHSKKCADCAENREVDHDNSLSELKTTDIEDCIENEDKPTTDAKTFLCTRHNISFPSQQALNEHYDSEHSRAAAKRKHYDEYVMENVEEASNIQPSDESGTSKNVDEPDDVKQEMVEPKIEVSVVKKRGRKPLHIDPEAVVKCNICYKTFANQDRLDLHMTKSHTAQKMQPVKCPNCAREFRNQIQCRNHVRQVHEGIKRKPSVSKPGQQVYQVCSVCHYMTPSKTRLLNHQLADHQGVMPYQCDKCPYTSRERADMNRHQRRHTGEKRYGCPQCDYATTERWILVNHARKQHGLQMETKSRDTMGCGMSKRWQARRRQQHQAEHALQFVHLVDTAASTMPEQTEVATADAITTEPQSLINVVQSLDEQSNADILQGQIEISEVSLSEAQQLSLVDGRQLNTVIPVSSIPTQETTKPGENILEVDMLPNPEDQVVSGHTSVTGQTDIVSHVEVLGQPEVGDQVICASEGRTEVVGDAEFMIIEEQEVVEEDATYIVWTEEVHN